VDGDDRIDKGGHSRASCEVAWVDRIIEHGGWSCASLDIGFASLGPNLQHVMQKFATRNAYRAPAGDFFFSPSDAKASF
jgi:hypothetical protein